MNPHPLEAYARLAAKPQADDPVDLLVVGAGVHSFHHLTVEACGLIAQARVVYFSDHEKGMRTFVSRLNPRIRPHDPYPLGAFRPDLYRRFALEVFEEAAREPNVAMLELGSAVVANRVTREVLSLAGERGLRVRVVPGVSSIETVLTEVGHDPATAGLQVFLAQELVLRQAAVDPACAVLVLQPGYYDTQFWLGLPRSKPGRFDRLVTHLRRFYGPETEMALVQTPGTVTTTAACVLWFRLGDMGCLTDHILPQQTLFIPPAAERTTDETFRDAIGSAEAIRAAVETDTDGRPSQRPTSDYHRPALSGLPEDLLERSREIAHRRKSGCGLDGHGEGRVADR